MDGCCVGIELAELNLARSDFNYYLSVAMIELKSHNHRQVASGDKEE
jgi:hypothetical protein